MNIFESIKNSLNLVTYPSPLWAAHVDCLNHTIAILRLNPQSVDYISIDKALTLRVVNNCLKVMTTMNNEKVSLPQLNYNVQTFNDVSNMLFAFDNYPMCNNLPLNMNLLNFPLPAAESKVEYSAGGKFQSATTYFPFAPTASVPSVEPEAASTQKLLTCEFCNKTSKNRGTHYKHMQTHAAHKQFLCSICGKSFRNSSHLNEHFVTHTSTKRVPCDLCNKTFSTASNLKAHIKTHSGERPHMCNTCGKSYTTSSNLHTHIRSIHQDDKPYACGVCDMRFVHPRALRLHMLKHTKERPFKCTYCEKSFPKKVHLTVHIRSHTGEKPYACTTCGKCFATSGNLKAHVKMH